MIIWEGCGRKGVWHENGGDDGGGVNDSPDRVASSRIDGACASDIFRLHHKTQKMACITPWASPHEWLNVSSGTGSPG